MHNPAANHASETISKFWNNYVSNLQHHGINQDLHRWYINHLEDYKIKQHTAKNVHDYLDMLGRNILLKNWQWSMLCRFFFANISIVTEPTI